MPWSSFKIRESYLEMRDSRLIELISYCDKFSEEFLLSERQREQLEWLPRAIREWMESCELPPGCIIIKFDVWISFPERHQQLARFFAFVAMKIRTTLPTAEEVVAKQAERLSGFVVESVNGPTNK